MKTKAPKNEVHTVTVRAPWNRGHSLCAVNACIQEMEAQGWNLKCKTEHPMGVLRRKLVFVLWFTKE